MNNRVNCPLHNATIIRVDSFNSSCLVKLDKANIGGGLAILLNKRVLMGGGVALTVDGKKVNFLTVDG